ncbi:hypothetical protein NXY06_05415 [Bacteroides uniformis]|uniref:hypothetical protein n=1 Tax=Bacteroides uniformis TaxID=820 RepID=UPI002165697C|nr:hypothetical protein [Bacteroides uniformis]MCS3350527.1 hypothetical protein [Bacteroides uniformis]
MRTEFRALLIKKSGAKVQIKSRNRVKKVGKYQKLMFEKHGIILFLIDNFSVSMLQCVMPLQTPFKWVFLRHRGTPSPTPGNSAFPGAGKQKNALPI